MMRASLASAMVATASASGTLALSFTDCGDASTHAVVKDIEPKSIVLGQKTDITGTGTVDEDVTGGSFEMKLSAAGIINEDFTGDICTSKSFDIKALGVKIGSISWEGLACPVAAGAASVPLSTSLASALPAALATTNIALTAKSTAGDKLICVDLKLQKQVSASVDCTKATCQSECECSLKQCADPINACLADATCAKGQSCAESCACGDTACSLNCATQAGSPLALPVATCINSKCASVEVEASVDCTKATCQSECECSLKQCADPINACLADATCAKGQSCAESCACGDTACSLNCATQAGSPLALPVATCINSKCASVEVEASVDCTKATCQSECECSLKQCADPINACLADATCAKGQSCAESCACGDTACSLNCATQAGSPLALPVATCINSKCASSTLMV